METLEEAIREHVALIDKVLSDREVTLSSRPLEAAVFFVTHMVLEVSGDTKDEFYKKPWFAVIFHHIREWYRETYGKAFDREGDKTATGVVLIRGIAIEVTVPLTTWTVEEVGKTGWLGFPNKVTDDERPVDWLVAPPNLARLGEQERAEIDHHCGRVASALRAARVNLMGVEPSDTVVDGLLAGVLPELEAAARHILLTKGRGPAIWSLQMALERIMKALLQQKTGTFKETHDLFDLFDLLKLDLPVSWRNRLKDFPRHKAAVSGRYGLGDHADLVHTIRAYMSGLALVEEISRHFTRKYNIGGASFLLQSPPWTKLPEPGSNTTPDHGKGPDE